MVQESRTRKTFLNARVNLIFYFLTLLLSFFSRKIFFDSLGADFLGLVGTLGNLLGFLNLAESGVSAAIAVVLYKPLFENNKTEINEIISVLGYLYKNIGKIILVGGIVLSCFFPLIFPHSNIDFSIIYFAYYSFLGSSLISYFINYKQILLSADQRNYVVSAYSQTANIIKTIIQMYLAFYTGNYFLWIIVEFLFGIIYSLILNWKIGKVYPWLNTKSLDGKTLNRNYPDVMKYTKQLFVHKIASVIYNQVTPFLVYAFASLQAVAFYSNYTLVTLKISTLLNNFLGGTNASVGNLIAERNNVKILNVFWELISIRFIFTGISVYCMYHLLPPFISLWLGYEYIMSNTLLILVLITFAMSTIRGVCEEFLSGYGLFSDIWAPFVEAAILIVVAIIGGHIWGLEGTLLGSIISSALIIYGWKPYFLFSQGFKISIWNYWIEFGKYLLITCLGFYISTIFLKLLRLNLNFYNNWIDWILYALIVVLLFSIIQIILLFLFTKGTRSLSKRIIKK